MTETITPAVRDRLMGCFVGLFVGDALGAPLEFSKRDSLPAITGYEAGGPFKLPAGYWTDDGSCALALAQCLLENNGRVSAADYLFKLSEWLYKGRFSSTGKCFDIGHQTRKAVVDYVRDGITVNGKDAKSQGNGCIMRLAPVVLVAGDETEAVELARVQCRTTHASSVCVKSSKALAGILFTETRGRQSRNPGVGSKPRSKIKSSGHVLATLEAAAWCVERTSSFGKAVLLAANLGDDSDTVAAVTGQWAGARYGLTGIPGPMLEGLHDVFAITSKAAELVDIRGE